MLLETIRRSIRANSRLIFYGFRLYCAAMKTVEFQTTWGTITLTLDDNESVSALDLPNLAETPNKEFAVLGGTRPPGAFKACAESPLHLERFQTLEDLTRKFQPIGRPKGTEFQQAVWNALMKIPRGQTRTYGQIAAAIGRPKAVRAVGSACGANPLPIFIPCHRVVSAGSPGGFGSGLPWKKLLLRLEGVQI